MFTVTPLHLEIVMHYNTRGCDMENLSAPAVREYIKDLLNTGMLVSVAHEAGSMRSYKTTERGEVWLEHLLRVPFPMQKWVME